MVQYWAILPARNMSSAGPKKFDPWKVKIFSNDCCFTDDTVMTIATKYAVLKRSSLCQGLRRIWKEVPECGLWNHVQKMD